MWPNPHFPADSVTFTEEIPNGKLQLCAVRDQGQYFWNAMTLIYEKEIDPDPPNQWKILSVLTVFKYFPPPHKSFFFSA